MSDALGPNGSADKTLGQIVSEVSEKASLLVREEIELAKAEITDKISKLTKGAVVAGAAAVFGVFGITMLFHTLAWFLSDAFDWDIWLGFAVVTAALFVLAGLSAFLATRLFKKGSPPTPNLAIEEARRTREQLEALRVESDQVHRTLEQGQEVTH
ncbi:MAG TPA: phage holin family protein [Thermoleophilaceae bacterium]|nr:phage holin family protein [Thermoleophilaceae bacterium]